MKAHPGHVAPSAPDSSHRERLACAGHQGFSTNLFALPGDSYPRWALGSIVGLGGFAGAAGGMLMARYAELVGQPRRIKRLLCETATDLGRERSFQGNGMLDVLRAFQHV